MEITEKKIGIVDTHVHLWDVSYLTYPWLQNNEKLNRNFLASDYSKATEGANVEKMVFVQCDPIPEQTVAEAVWVAEQAKKEPRIEGIVAGAPVENGASVAEVLQELSEIKTVVGIRRLLQTQSDPDFCIKPEFIEGVRLLEKHNMSFDICLVPSYLPNAAKLVRACPNIQFILDHNGNPAVSKDEFEPWASDITRLAELPNVIGKVSGIISAAGDNWTAETLRPYIEHMIEAFGWERLVFGGDWPVVTLAGSWRSWFDALLELLSEVSYSERKKILRDNAIRVYKLPE